MSKTKKRFLILAGILLTIVIVGIFSINGIIAGIISGKIDNILEKHPVKNYHISYQRVGYNLLNHSARIINFTYIPNQDYLDSLTATSTGYTVPEIHLEKLIISGIDYKRAFSEKHIELNKILVKNLNVKLWKIEGKAKSTKKSSHTQIPDSIQINGIDGLSTHKFIIEKSKVELIDRKTNKTIATNSEISALLSEFKLVSTGHQNNFFRPVVADATLQLNDFVFFTPKKLYKLSAKRITLNWSDKDIFIYKLHYQPLYSKKDFSKHIKFQTERYDFSLKNIKLSLPDIKALVNSNRLILSIVQINDARFNIYRDKQVPFDHSKRPLLPNQAIKRLALQLNINTISIKNSTFAYEETTGRSEQPLYINFKNLSAEITNLSNLKNRTYQESKMKVVLKGRLMGEAPFDMQILFPLKARNDTFVFSGTVYGKVLLKTFNKASYPAAGINIKSGIMNKLTFKGGANPYHSKGTLTFLYNNVKLDIITKDKKEANKFLSWGATTMIRKDNPSAGKTPKQAIMAFDRNMEKGFGNFLWKTIFTGIKATFIGGKKSLVQPVKTTNDKKTKKRKKRKQ
ncbi:MAG: hypothetical protein DRJ09_05745 [Bacteroidetes bacterium]|nr:MAG: hypothetical protein DRJ09_05745 [Bacteroidota bacterium]